MRLHAPILALAALALSACGEEQTAQAPTEPRSPSATETAQAPPAPAPTTQTPPPPSAAGSGAADAPSATGNVGRSPPPSGNQTAASPAAAGLQPFQGRSYAAGPISLQLNPDNTFVMNEVEGNRKVEGRYVFQDGTVTFSDPKGDVGPAKFPMRCRLEPAGSEFRLIDTEGSCERFKDVTFKPAAG